MMFDIEFGIKFFELLIVKLSIIVDDDDLREVELIDVRFSYKFSSLGLNDLGHQLGLHQFGEVVDGYK